MKILFVNTVIALFFLNLFGGNEVDFSSEEFLNSSLFNSTIDLKSIDVELIELGVLHLSNSYRQKKGKLPLRYNAPLSDAAYLHSEQMEIFDFFDHVNRRNKQLSTMDRRAAAAGYTNYQTLAENIYYGAIDISQPVSYYALCETIVSAFIESKGHRLNLLASDVNDMGCGLHFEKSLKQGYWYFYFTQDFGSQ